MHQGLRGEVGPEDAVDRDRGLVEHQRQLSTENHQVWRSQHSRLCCTRTLVSRKGTNSLQQRCRSLNEGWKRSLLSRRAHPSGVETPTP